MIELTIVAISDTHNQHSKITIPECDLLIHTGDWTTQGIFSEVKNFAQWFNSQKQAKYRIAIPGNHELIFETQLPLSRTWWEENAPESTLLINESIILPEFGKIFGSPFTPYFNNWAWNKHPSQLKEIWQNIIPEDTDILLTHGPAYDILDKVDYGRMTGCLYLLQAIEKIKPKLHIHGHIHSNHGKHINVDTTHYNVCICDESYKPSQPITIIKYTSKIN